MGEPPYKCAQCGLVNPATEPACRRCRAARDAAPTADIVDGSTEKPAAGATPNERRVVAFIVAVLGTLLLGAQVLQARAGTLESYYPKLNIVVAALVGVSIAGLFDPDILRGEKHVSPRTRVAVAVVVVCSMAVGFALNFWLG